MDTDTIWTVVKIILAIYLILWIINVFIGYVLFHEKETFGNHIMSPYMNHPLGNFFYSLIALTLPYVRLLASNLLDAFITRRWPTVEDLKPLSPREK
jgi:hypothetical protein